MPATLGKLTSDLVGKSETRFKAGRWLTWLAVHEAQAIIIVSQGVAPS